MTTFLALMLAMAPKPGFVRPPSADVLIGSAMHESLAVKKNIFVACLSTQDKFSRAMRSTLSDLAVARVMDRHFVIRFMRAGELPNQRGLENASVRQYMTDQSGKSWPGVPFWFIIDGHGKKVANGMDASGNNTGCPWELKEIQLFARAVKKGAPTITPAELKVLTDAFGQLKKKDQTAAAAGKSRPTTPRSGQRQMRSAR